MLRPSRILLLALTMGIVLGPAWANAQDCYAFIVGNGGDPISALSGTTVSGHANDTKIIAFGFNAFRPVDGSLNPGALEAQPLRIAKFFDGSSPRLLDAFGGAEVLDSMVVSCEQGGGSPTEFSRITLTGATVVGISSAADTGQPASEIVTFSYTQFDWLDPVGGGAGKFNP
jgi:type VI secretion system Hcp family effector